MEQKSKVMNTLKIKSIKYDYDVAKKENRKTDGHAIITVVKNGEEVNFRVDREFVKSKGPIVGGWLIQYEGDTFDFMGDSEFKIKNAKHPLTEKEAFSAKEDHVIGSDEGSFPEDELPCCDNPDDCEEPISDNITIPEGEEVIINENEDENV